MLRKVLEKYHSFRGFALLLGGLLLYANAEQSLQTLPPGLRATWYLIHQRREGHILDDLGLSRIPGLYYRIPISAPHTGEFFAYFAGLLENPDRSGTAVFNKQRYAVAAKECLELCLGNHLNFSKGTTESAHFDMALRRSKPWAWLRKFGVHSRIRKGKYYLKVRQHELLEAGIFVEQHASFPKTSPEHEYYRSLAYQWALDLLPFLLEKSALSLELAKVMRGCSFTTMAWRFPRRRRLAKEAIMGYLLRVESTQWANP